MLPLRKYIMRGMAVAVPLFLVLTGCVNDQSEVKKVVNEYEGPLRVQTNVDYVYTDSGVVRLNFMAPKAIDYSHLEEDEAYLEFPEGIDVIMYTDSGTVETTLRADYAIQYIGQQRWEAEGGVHVENDKEEALSTEKLEWNMATHRISSDVAVTISTPDTKIWGKGFEADENMNDYEIHEIYGTIYLDETDTTKTDVENL